MYISSYSGLMAAANAGRKAKPAALKLIEGRGGGRDSGGRVVKEPPGFVRLPPEPPGFLSRDAIEEWHRIVPELQRLHLTKPIETAGLTAYCLTWQRLVDAQALIDANPTGLLYEGKQGLVRHPAVGVIESASKDLRAWAAEWGLTAASEQKLSTSEATDGDANPFDD